MKRTAYVALVVVFLTPLAGIGSPIRELPSLRPGATDFVGGLSTVGSQVYFSSFAVGVSSRLGRTDGTPGGTASVLTYPGGVEGAIFGVADSLFDLDPSGLSLNLLGLTNGHFVTLDLQGSRPVAWRDEAWYSNGGSLITFHSSIGHPVVRFSLPPDHWGGRIAFADDEALYLLRSAGGSVKLDAFDGQTITELADLGVESVEELHPVALDGRSVFAVFGDFGSRLWRTDGTPGGTYVLRELRIARPEAVPVRLGDRAFFFDLGEGDWELCATDGSPAGTAVVEPFRELEADPGRLWSAGSRLYFTIATHELGREPWVSDGVAPASRLADLAPGPASSDPGDFVEVAGRTFFTAVDPSAGRELWLTDGTDLGTGRVEDLLAGAGSSDPRELTALGSRLLFTALDAAGSRALHALDVADPDSFCVPSGEAVCLGEGRFRVEVDWTDFAGASGNGEVIPPTSESGGFWFFAADNVEVLVKVLDGRGVNDHFWVFEGAQSNVAHRLTLFDTLTSRVRRYDNPAGRYAAFADIEAFADETAGSPFAPQPAEPPGATREPFVPAGPCVPSATRLCLGEGRFSVEVAWTDFSGHAGAGSAVPFSEVSGRFSFFDPDNVELFVKVFDGRELNGKFWVFSAALTNVGYRLTVRDHLLGIEKTYVNPAGRQASFGDTDAF